MGAKMARKLKTCVMCGCKFWGRGNSLYCQNTCKYKAYRARKKQIKISRQHTLSLDENPYFEKVLEWAGRSSSSRYALEEILLISRRDTWRDILLNLSTIVSDAYQEGKIA
jgi:hypothetical protein